jgi:hypothetical protein
MRPVLSTWGKESIVESDGTSLHLCGQEALIGAFINFSKSHLARERLDA